MNRETSQNYRQLSFWLDTVPGELETRARLEGEHRTETVIVGAGYTGLWTAYYLKKHQPDRDITVVEAETAGFGASGRNGGWCSAYLSGIEQWLENPVTRDGAIRLQQQMYDAVAEVGRVCEKENIDSHFDQSGVLEVAVNEQQEHRLREELEEAEGLGIDHGFRWLDQAEAMQELRIHGTRCALHNPHTAAVHPARLARGLAETVEKSGVTIFENSPALDIQPGTVRCSSGEIIADQVIIATEGYSNSIPQRRHDLQPVHSMMVATEPLTDAQFAEIGLARRYCFGSLHHMVTYGQRTADNRIAFGSRGGYFFNSALKTFSGDEKAFDIVRNALLELLPQLQGVKFTHAWGGAMGVGRSRRPAVMYDEQRRLGWAGGYFGNGVGAANLAGRTMADLLLVRDSERVTTPWVNDSDRRPRWEPEPLRYLAFRSVSRMMQASDWLEFRNSSSSSTLGKLVTWITS